MRTSKQVKRYNQLSQQQLSLTRTVIQTLSDSSSDDDFSIPTFSDHGVEGEMSDVESNEAMR